MVSQKATQGAQIRANAQQSCAVGNKMACRQQMVELLLVYLFSEEMLPVQRDLLRDQNTHNSIMLLGRIFCCQVSWVESLLKL